MSFGLFKNGVNSTDKKLIKRFTAAGWPIDKISQKLSVRPAVIKKLIAYNAAQETSAPVAEVEAADPVESAEDAADAEAAIDAPVAEPKVARKKTAAKAK